MIRIIQYRNKCIGCNACVEVNKDRWRMSRKDGKSTLIKGIEKRGVYRVAIDEDELALAQAAELICPVRIIRVAKT